MTNAHMTFDEFFEYLFKILKLQLGTEEFEDIYDDMEIVADVIGVNHPELLAEGMFIVGEDEHRDFAYATLRDLFEEEISRWSLMLGLKLAERRFREALYA